jgi:hypothetical protein
MPSRPGTRAGSGFLPVGSAAEPAPQRRPQQQHTRHRGGAEEHDPQEAIAAPDAEAGTEVAAEQITIADIAAEGSVASSLLLSLSLSSVPTMTITT